MTVYCDTSLLIAALVTEPATRPVQEWLARQDAGTLRISDWSTTEFSSAVAMKVRTGALSPQDRAGVLATWTKLRNGSLVQLNVLPAHFAMAATFVEQADLRLRAGDALHLAIAAANGCALATFDAAQAKAAIVLGIPVESI